jgi:type I restriction enzyme S subunit
MVDLIAENIDIWTSAQTIKTNGRGRSADNQSLHGIKKLRELILELAMRGKLVPQDPNDEPAKILLENIAKEKARLIKEGKIKKQEPLPEIGEEVKPFELPKGWEWTRLGNLSANIHYGYTASADHGNSGIRLLRITDIQNDSVNWETVPGCEIEEDKANDYLLQNDDILIARTGGTIGKSYIVENIDVKAVFASYLIRAKRIEGMYAPFVKTYLGSRLYWQQLYENSMGTGQPNVNATALKGLVFPIPPFVEQHRIVAKVDELMALCDRLEQQQTDSNAAHQILVETLLTTLTDAADQGELEAAWQRIANHFETLFTTEHSIDQLKQTILQLAVMGKLVPQDPNDEPASVLLERIEREKARLIREGKIKSQNELSEVEESEKPFELPMGWAWVQWDRIALKIGDIDHKMPDQANDGYPYVSPRDFLPNNGIGLEGAKKISKEDFLRLAAKIQPQRGDIIYPRYGTIGENRLVETEADFLASYSCCVIKTMHDFIEPKFQFIFSVSMLAKNQAKQAENKTTQANVGIKSIQNYLVPLPPYAEQHRIVAKVDELMAICDTLKARLNDAQTAQIQLADAIVEKAVV